MKKNIILSIMALAIISMAIGFVGCKKGKDTEIEETNFAEESNSAIDYRYITLKDMALSLSDKESTDFFNTQIIKDYTDICESVMKDCDFEQRKAESQKIKIKWHWASQSTNCNSQHPGICIIFKENEESEANAYMIKEDDKLIIIPTIDEDGFTKDGYLAIGTDIVIPNSSAAIEKGIYTAYYDDEYGKYTAVAVDLKR